jgi:hypothetical protein
MPTSCAICPFLPEATAIYDPAAGVWSRLPTDPLAVPNLTSVWTGAALFSYNLGTKVDDTPPGNVSAYDPVAQQWVGLPPAPFGCASYPANMLWTGRAVLLYCSRTLPASTAISGLEFEVD